jgi:phosphoserine phosphatase
MAVDAVLFDLDMTLVDSSSIQSYRKAQLWDLVRREFGRVKPFEVDDGVSPHTVPAEIRKHGIRVGIVTSSPQ